MKRIKEIVEKVQFYFGKKETGFHSIPDIVRELNVESTMVFDDLHDEYSKTRKISEFLQPFMKSAQVSINDQGIGTKPSDFAHATGTYLSDGTPTEIIETAFWVERLKHPNKAPTTSYPILRMIGSNIEVKPVTVAEIQLDYLKLPTPAVYAFTTTNDEYVYDDDLSVDWEWSKTIEDRIINRTLKNLGINIKDRDLVNFSQNGQVQE